MTDRSWDTELQDDLLRLWSLNMNLWLDCLTDREADFHAGLSRALRALMKGDRIPDEAWERMESANPIKAYAK